jgi:uncharacterized protein
MNPDTLSLARQFLLASLQTQANVRENRHPWRRGWEFAAQHSLRVEALAVKILGRQPHGLDHNQVNLIRLAAILHDIKRSETAERSGHAAAGALAAGEWLAAHPELGLSASEVQYVVEMIAGHSNKSKPDPDLCSAVLKDADTLDEIGAISIFMSANWLDRESPFFFQHLAERLEKFEIPFCDQKLAILNTEGARQILREKKAFIERFLRQLRAELEMQDRLVYEFLPDGSQESIK